MEENMPQNCYELVWIFIIYAFIGWCTEVSYAALDRGIFVNRGFLNGPYCPIYGCGVVIVVAVLHWKTICWYCLSGLFCWPPFWNILLDIYWKKYFITSGGIILTNRLIFTVMSVWNFRFTGDWHVLSSWMCCTRSFIKESHWCRILSEWF